MPVIALSPFVVVTKYAAAFYYIDQAVLIVMFRALNGIRYFPDANVRE